MKKRLINQQPGRAATLLLSMLPFALLMLAYLIGSEARLAANPGDKLLPSPATIASTVSRLAFEPSKRSGELILWRDTVASLQRLFTGVAISALIGLCFGVATGVIPYLRETLGAFIAALSMVPPLALLPILFIVFGLGELAKVVLIVIGITPFIMRDLSQRVAELPLEQLIKAQTLGASSWQLIIRVVLPQILPRLIDAVRLSLGAAWLFLIAAEAIAATEGLGYRIFLVRRYLAMDTILSYVVWITLLAFLLDFLLKRLSLQLFPWTRNQAAAA
jgi:NitT/TauT family transport system permease protein